MASTRPVSAHHPAQAVEERAGRASPGGSDEPLQRHLHCLPARSRPPSTTAKPPESMKIAEWLQDRDTPRIHGRAVELHCGLGSLQVTHVLDGCDTTQCHVFGAVNQETLSSSLLLHVHTALQRFLGCFGSPAPHGRRRCHSSVIALGCWPTERHDGAWRWPQIFQPEYDYGCERCEMRRNIASAIVCFSAWRLPCARKGFS